MNLVVKSLTLSLTLSLGSVTVFVWPQLNHTFDGVFFTHLIDGGGLILSTLFPFVETIEK